MRKLSKEQGGKSKINGKKGKEDRDKENEKNKKIGNKKKIISEYLALRR